MPQKLQFNEYRISISSSNKYYTDILSEQLITSVYLGQYGCIIPFGNEFSIYRKRIDNDDISLCLGLLARFPQQIHSFFGNIMNLCGSKKFLAWNGNDSQDKKTKTMISEIQYELDVMHKFKGKSIISLGKYLDKTKAIISACKTLDLLEFKSGTQLLIRNDLNISHAVGITLDDIQSALNTVNPDTLKHLGVCVHLTYFHANGLYDISKLSGIKQCISDIQTKLSVRPTVFILYDTDTEFGSKRCEPVDLFTGKMWSDVMSNQETIDVIFYILEYCKMNNISIISYSDSDVQIIQYLIDLI